MARFALALLGTVMLGYKCEGTPMGRPTDVVFLEVGVHSIKYRPPAGAFDPGIGEGPLQEDGLRNLGVIEVEPESYDFSGIDIFLQSQKLSPCPSSSDPIVEVERTFRTPTAPYRVLLQTDEWGRVDRTVTPTTLAGCGKTPCRACNPMVHA